MIGRRIAVYGPSGSGKSIFARTLGELLGLPVIELDSLFHKPNWQPTPDDEFKATVLALLSRYRNGWVCDGNYHDIRPLVIPRAENIVWLRLPFPTVYWRLFYRTVTRAWSREPLWGTNLRIVATIVPQPRIDPALGHHPLAGAPPRCRPGAGHDPPPGEHH